MRYKMNNTFAVAVAGGGIAGITCSLELADAGYFVYLVEKKPGLGGLLPQIESLFPTKECSPCQISTRLLECSRHQNITIYTNSEVLGIEGPEGNMLVHIRKHTDFINTNKCIACNKCSEVCLKSVPDQFNLNMASRKAAYILHHQSIPPKYVIDERACLKLTRGICGICQKVCPTEAIDFNDQGKDLSLQVGSVVLAPGLIQAEPFPSDIYGYGFFSDVITSMAYERLLSFSGPNSGILKRPSDRTEPRKVAWIQCVGSRRINNAQRSFCSSICCMSSIKQALVSKDHVFGKNLECTIFFNEIRIQNKGGEKFYQKARDQGVRFIRSLPDNVMPGKEGKGVSISYVTCESEFKREEFDLLVLSVGFNSAYHWMNNMDSLNIRTDRHGFALSSSFRPFASSRPGIYLTGSMTSPRDVRQSVAHAAGAANASTIKMVHKETKNVLSHIAPKEEKYPGYEPRIGIFICCCGGNISNVINNEALTEYASGIPGVHLAESNLYSCAKITQEKIAQQIEDKNLNRVIIAACTPVTHEAHYRKTLQAAGLNPYLLEMINIRNQNSWVHQKKPVEAANKARIQIAAAVSKSMLKKPLQPVRKPVVRRALVIGGGLTGMTVALDLARQKIKTILIEKSNHLGGNAWNIKNTWNGEDIQAHLQKSISKVESDPRITVMKNARVISCRGSIGNFISNIQMNRSGGVTLVETIRYGAAVFCTGAREYKPNEYLYGQDQRVFTHQEFGAKIIRESEELKHTDCIVFIQCVGSREAEQAAYCSRICCTRTMQNALQLKRINPAMRIYVINKDICTYGTKEKLYHQALKEGVIFIKYSYNSKPQVKATKKSLKVTVRDHILDLFLEINANFLVLASAIVPDPDTRNLANIFKFPLNDDGFTIEDSYSLKPVDMVVKGVFAAGLCNYPKPIEESQVQAQAVVSRVRQILNRDEIHLDPSKANFTDNCIRCGLCAEKCPYNAIEVEGAQESDVTERSVSLDKAACEGCGVCVSICPHEGIRVDGFDLDAIDAQISGMVKAAETLLKNEPIILAFCCDWGSYRAADTAGLFKHQYSPGVYIIRLSCVCILKPETILNSLQKGVDGIMIMGCRKDECRFRHGNYHAAGRIPQAKSMMKKYGMNPERLMSGWISPTEGALFAESANAFMLQIKKLFPVPARYLDEIKSGRVNPKSNSDSHSLRF